MNHKIILIFSLLLALSCQQKSPYIHSRDLEELDLKITRFEREFNDLKNKGIADHKRTLSHRYPDFFPIYNQGVVRIGRVDDDKYNFYANKFLTDSIYIEVYDSVLAHFPTMEKYETEFNTAFSRYHAIFPQKQIPAIYTHISGFNEPIVVADSILSISLENYLGPDHDFYKRLGTYTYQLKHKDEKHLTSDAMRGWLRSEYELAPHATLLDHMIYEGKIIFVLQQIVPQASIADLIGISEEQLAWCKQHQSSTWTFMIEKKHLFSNRNSIIAKYIQDGPFFNFVGSGSSPMVGKYLGWKIVSSYMKNKTDKELNTLLNDGNSQSILGESKFKP